MLGLRLALPVSLFVRVSLYMILVLLSNFPFHLAHEHLLCGEHDYLPNDLPALGPVITAGPYTLLVDVTGILNGNDM